MSTVITQRQIELSPLPAATLSSSRYSPHGDIATSPHPGRQIFEATGTNTVGRSRQLSATILIIASNLVQMLSNITSMSGGLAISKSLGIDTGPGKANWIAASYPLTQGTFVLISGRLGEIYSHRRILLLGGIWLTLWSLINGFCDNFISFNIARAMAGIGGALIMPNAVAMISITCPPGKLRNTSLGFFGASGPISGSIGSIFVGLVIQYLQWRWIYFILAFICVPVFGLLWFLLPHENAVDPGGKLDFVGAALGTSGLIVFNIAWNQAPAVGWSTPYEVVFLLLSIILLCSFCIWEGKYASKPIMPLDIWNAPSFFPLVFVVLFSFMSFATLLWYMIAWQQEVRHWTVLRFGIGWIPFGVFGTLGALLAGWLIPRLAAQWILAIGLGTVLVANLLLATMPDQQIYWAQVFPATILMAFCPDLVYTAAQIIASNTVRRSQQGTAASLIGLLNLYGGSLGLGFAGTVETEVNKSAIDVTAGYKGALYFGAGVAALALLFDVLYVRMVRDQREGWENPEDADAAAEPEATSTATGFRL
ncbi:hypothetical protein BP6252_09614 [Coleophoma cylindrospora]|uniref:Major facilitator superfamily (MFS) profile domain-containing protein n=1 Tax=Coleophoma cylindrospora TaxID=1849047 RepID=A0A3D8QW38_9HELO|nr:hypothetical protein BP6252_09614 [Coleophoma cylindrospora]